MRVDDAIVAWIAAHLVEIFSALLLVAAYVALGAWTGKGRR